MKRNSKAKPTPRTVPNLAALARLENVSRATTTRWNRDGAIVWDGDQIDVSGTRRLVKELAGPTKDPRLAAAKLEILQAEAKLRVLRLRQREGELTETADVEDVLLGSFATVRTSLGGTAPWLASEVATLDPRTAFADLCRKIDERFEQAVYSAYINARAALAIAADASPGKAARIARESWRGVFPGTWQEKGDVDEKIARRQIEEMKARSKATGETPPGEGEKEGQK